MYNCLQNLILNFCKKNNFPVFFFFKYLIFFSFSLKSIINYSLILNFSLQLKFEDIFIFTFLLEYIIFNILINKK